ncbi:carbohydrate ABC transporter permease [Paenibacillus sp. FSL H7-0331]|uniref:carbohydrate ABC transporter permease n=1 Tax=Paenibacillus sp. FSL H7-0331 TaxID=1920421 RepID=UPI00096D7207|nr:carbohydrate ABC transporter permease [Paenibacillus sp. FSL H7-0331]OMF00506.1 sugar ABC transporter permease [Paenibacillus sp. FSL H7-0331]
MHKLSNGEKIFNVFNYLFLSLLAFATLYPFWYVLVSSLSTGEAVSHGKVWLWPSGVNLESYKKVIHYEGIWIAYANTLFYTAVGTAVDLAFTTMGAYPLSKKRLLGRKPVTLFITFAMLFGAGLIPVYLNFRNLGLIDTRMALIIGFAVNTFYVFILRSFFSAIPDELEEAARIDGAGGAQILLRIYLPLAKPALAALGLFYAVGKWNGYFWAMVLLRDENKIPLQVLLNKLVVQMRASDQMLGIQDVGSSMTPETVIYATIMVAVLPIIVIYPFIQKYFVQGVMIGSVKG